MTRLIIAFVGAVGLILLTAYVAARLVRIRIEGISIRMQVFVALALIVGAFAAGLGLLVLDRIEARATLLASEAARNEATAIASFISGQIDPSGLSLDDIAKTLDAQRSRGGPARLSLALISPDGVEVFSEPPSPNEEGTVMVTVPIETRRGVAGSVRVVKPTIIMRRLLEDFAPTVLFISAILGAAAAAAAAIIGRAIATPIEDLTTFAERVSEGQRAMLPPNSHGSEVKRLTKAIETMRRELEGRPYVESFAADLSHELKNPVAAIRAAAEVLDEGALAEPDQALRFVRRIREATGRIEALLSELLSLARIESRGLESHDLISLDKIVRGMIDAKASQRSVHLVVSETPAHVRGDERWLLRAVDNLLSNALIHGDAGQTVTVVVGNEDKSVFVGVTNVGRIAPHIRKRLFRRFVTSRGEKGGTGLGLAIVRAVAEAHGGSVQVLEREPREVEFRLVMPRA